MAIIETKTIALLLKTGILRAYFRHKKEHCYRHVTLFYLHNLKPDNHHYKQNRKNEIVNRIVYETVIIVLVNEPQPKHKVFISDENAFVLFFKKESFEFRKIDIRKTLFHYFFNFLHLF